MGVAPQLKSSSSLPGNRSRLRKVFSRGNLTSATVVVALLVLVGVTCRNRLARYVVTQVGSRVLGTRVEIGKVDIDWSAVSISDLEVFEPTIPGQRQLTVQSIRLVPSLWQGLRSGVWLAEAAISSPTAEVRFDRDGNLLSVFPQSPESSESTGPIKIPVAKVWVHDAALKIHQVGRDDFRVSKVQLSVIADNRIKVTLMVPDMMGGRCKILSDLDATTLEGRSFIEVVDLHLDTPTLATLPLVPASLASEPFSVDAGLQVLVRHPPDDFDLRKYSVQVHAWTANAQAQRIGMLCGRSDLSVICEGGQVNVNITANPLAGTWKCNGSIDLTAAEPELVVDARLKGCEWALLAKAIPALSKLQTDTTASTQWRVVLDEGTLRFVGNAYAGMANSFYDKVAVPIVDASVHVDGLLRLDDPATLTGSMQGSIGSEPFDLSTLARSLELPITGGTVIARGEFAIPLDSIANTRSYSATAAIDTTEVGTSELKMDDASLAARLADGIATIELRNCVVRDSGQTLLAEVNSTTTVSLKEGGKLVSSSMIFVEPSSEIVRMLNADSFDPGGRMIASLTASCPTERIATSDGWLADARVQTQALSALGETISDIDWKAKLADGVVQCTPLKMTWRGHTLVANTSAEIGSRIAIHGDFSLDSLRLAELSEVMSRYSQTRLSLAGLAGIEGAVAFTSELENGHSTFDASGSADLTSASYAFTQIGDAKLQWAADQNGLRLSTSSANFLGGRFDVNAHVNELDWTRTQVEGRFAGVEASRLMKLAGQTIPATGTIEGGFRVTSIASVESLTGDAWIGSKQLSVRRLPMQVDRATLTVDRGELSLAASGNVVDGTFHAQAAGSLPQVVRFFEQRSPTMAQLPVTANLTLTGLRTESLFRQLNLPRDAQAISARLSADCKRESSAWDGRHLCTASAVIEDLRYHHQGWSQRMSVETVLHADRLEIEGVRGRFADGGLAGSGEVSFRQSPVGRFDFSASHVNLRRATSPLGLNDISGTGTLRVRGRIGPVITGQLDASVDNLSAAGVGVRKAKFPVDWSFRPAANLARWQCRAGTMSVGGGNVRVATEGSYSGSLSATTSVRIEKIDLAKLMQNGSAGSGTISGDATLRAKNARAASDLVGSFTMEMRNIQAMQIPVIDQLPKMITLSPPVPGRGQDGGTVRGRIAGGLVHLDEVAIHQSNVQVMVTGNATMTGKLDLDIVASTESTSPTDQLISMLDSPVMLAAPAPVALVLKANELLKDRVVRVHVGGTAARPTLRLQPGKQLSQDAVRFFLSSSLGPAADRLTESQSNHRRR